MTQLFENTSGANLVLNRMDSVAAVVTTAVAAMRGMVKAVNKINGALEGCMKSGVSFPLGMDSFQAYSPHAMKGTLVADVSFPCYIFISNQSSVPS